jgi:hypothetical protein
MSARSKKKRRAPAEQTTPWEHLQILYALGDCLQPAAQTRRQNQELEDSIRLANAAYERLLLAQAEAAALRIGRTKSPEFLYEAPTKPVLVRKAGGG